MKSKFTISFLLACTFLLAACSKKDFNEQDAIEAQKQLLELKYQHEIDLETLKQKGATALQQLVNTAALQQLKLNDSLTQARTVATRKQDYSVVVVDVINNTPIADATVTVSSEGKLFSANTNAQGTVSFTNLLLFPTSSFTITKTGYAATQILQQNITSQPVRLWNTTDLSNEITGTLYIETDLTNATPEKVGANVLVTASTTIASTLTGYYSVLFPAYTTAAGTYSIKLPAAPNNYTLTFATITADQKLFVNATEDDAVTTFPAALPRATTITTYFNVNNYVISPTVNNAYYFKVAADNNGKVLYFPGANYNNYYFYYNQVFLSSTGNTYQAERLNVTNYVNGNNDIITYTYTPNSKINVDLVDVAGNVVQTAPMLMATTNANGKLNYYTSPENGYGYVHLKRDAAGALVTNAKGVILRASLYDSYSNLYNLNYTNNLNTTTNNFVLNTYLLNSKNDKRIVNFYYGSGSSRAKQVY
ncbi:MAG: hypothetical protein EOP42_05205 [Sphingobacteriaceae bacterium]|nr:MAG: hypothetical protein EOP42_05205 [Sphingobacteriaceae bacterium]